MQIFYTIEDFQKARAKLDAHTQVGFVPTMGNLHHGHASLVERAKSENTVTVVSIFINPTQFNQSKDFETYPRTLEQDLQLLQALQVDWCFLPTQDAMYADDYRFKVEENKLNLLMEGRARPGHFSGVLTVVLKLLHIVKAHHSYFGEKDYQQYQLIRDMAEAFFLDTQIHACPTVREPSGLAFSSRNNRLSPVGRKKAAAFAQIVHQKKTCLQIIEDLKKEAIAVDYVLDYEDRRYVAAFIEEVRLIDNWVDSEVF